MKELRDILREFGASAQNIALATIVGTTGSSYRKAGARMLIFPDGRTVGTLSGGCIEEEVAQRALPIIAGGGTSLFAIDMLRRFGCQGSIQIFLERIEPGNEFLAYLQRCGAERKPARVLVVHDSASAAGRCGSLPREDSPPGCEGFEETIAPPIRILILGDGPGTDALVRFAGTLGWDAAVFDGVEAAAIKADHRTAVVVQNHHFGRDFKSLQWALPQPFGYVGLLGSRKRKLDLIEALVGEGWVPANASLRHFHGPAGLDLGANAPEEIALSVVAEIQAVMTGHEGGFLRNLRRPIHEPVWAAAVS